VDRNQTLAVLRERIVTHAASRLQRDVAEDLAQEVLMLLEEKYAHVEAIEELIPLCFQILRFKMLSLYRKSARRGEFKQVPVAELPLVDPGPDPATRAELLEMRARLKAALARLDGRCREMFRLKLEGKTFPEIQGILKAGSLNTVYTWDFRCRKQLLKLMGGDWEGRR
jgi:RNA polymerase sigma-70 factor (ECF subfamily)